jgi:hypothetical protein
MLGLLLVGLIPMRAQSEPSQTGAVTGRVLSELTGAYLANARVTVEGVPPPPPP